MDEGTMQHIFEPFFTTKPTGQGTGLGLSTVHGIVSQSGGNILVDSTPGQGTTFRLLLPLVAGHEGAAAPVPAAPTFEPAEVPRREKTVLLVEDEPTVRDLTALQLSEAGFDVLEASDFAEAMEVVRRFDGKSIDLLLTDVVLPGPDGTAVADAVRREAPGVKTLLMSGYAEEHMRSRLGAGRDIAFIGKPFKSEDLLEKVEHLLEI
jgi:CheY-like chemotaxis protein